MGGPGSGPWPGARPTAPKETTEDYFGLDVRALKRQGLITAGAEELPGAARIVWIPSGFGGPGGSPRPWFLCPGCGRRAAILYGRPPPTGAPKSWLCRTCGDLRYPVEREGRWSRAARRMRKARARLGPGGAKPPRMRHETYLRLRAEYLAASAACGAIGHEQLSRFLEQMAREKIELDL